MPQVSLARGWQTCVRKITPRLGLARGIEAGESNQVDFLGVSVSETLPQDPVVEENPCCSAEKA